MILFFIADIHGSLYYTKQAIDKFKEEKADYMIILGDILYHGPRNPLPREYNPEEVSKLLNKYRDKIIAVRGNCDSEVDQMVLEFPMMADYTIILYNGKKIFATHGHQFNLENMPNIEKGDVLVNGHTHLPVADIVKERYIINPGSISLPKGKNTSTYGILQENVFSIKDFKGNQIKQIELK